VSDVSVSTKRPSGLCTVGSGGSGERGVGHSTTGGSKASGSEVSAGMEGAAGSSVGRATAAVLLSTQAGAGTVAGVVGLVGGVGGSSGDIAA
jgi:hypothetical protein